MHASKYVWLIDLGVSLHMTSHWGWFSNYEEYDCVKVYLYDVSHQNVACCGRVKIKFSNGWVKGIDVLMHILVFALNLLSECKMSDLGVQVFLPQGGCKMTRGFVMIIKGVQNSTLYKLDECTVQCNTYSMESKKRALDSSYSLLGQAIKIIVASTSNGHSL